MLSYTIQMLMTSCFLKNEPWIKIDILCKKLIFSEISQLSKSEFVSQFNFVEILGCYPKCTANTPTNYINQIRDYWIQQFLENISKG